MKILGAHLSTNKGLENMQNEMDSINADTCALFVKNHRRYSSPPMSKSTIYSFRKSTKNPSVLVPHGSFLMNLGNENKIEASYKCLIDELKRCHALGIVLYNIHPGSDVAAVKNKNKAMDRVAQSINNAHKEVDDVIILLENMAGQGNTFGKTFEELKYMIDKIENKKRIGVTLDTAHLFGAGYDITTSEKFESVMKNFDKIVGLKYLKAVHLNDSKVELNSRKDRHEEIGKGKIGIEAFRYIMNSNYFENIPLILETPNVLNYKNEIELLKSLIE